MRHVTTKITKEHKDYGVYGPTILACFVRIVPVVVL